MNKHKDLSANIMQKVISYEKKRTSRFVAGFLMLLVIGIIIIFAGAYLLVTELMQEEIAGLLSMFFGDQEILGLIWQDALFFIWEVVPHYAVYSVGIVVLAIIILFAATSHKRRIIARRMREINKL